MIVKKIQVVTLNSGNGNSTTITGKNHGDIIPFFGWKRPKCLTSYSILHPQINGEFTGDGWLWWLIVGIPSWCTWLGFFMFFPLGRLEPPSPDTSNHRGTFVATEDLRLGQNSMQFFGGDENTGL